MLKVAPLFLFFLMSCSLLDGDIYTLYRSSEIIERIHIATFDSKNGENYNRDNCIIASELFQNQPFVTSKYWCEKGGYRK